MFLKIKIKLVTIILVTISDLPTGFAQEKPVVFEKFTTRDGLSQNTVFSMTQDQDGFIWIGTYGGGLNRFDPETEKFSSFREYNSDLPIDAVYATLPDNDGEMFGYKRVRNAFEDVAERKPEEIISPLKDTGSKWVNDQNPDDDVTLVVLKMKQNGLI